MRRIGYAHTAGEHERVPLGVGPVSALEFSTIAVSIFSKTSCNQIANAKSASD
jgi:hypothetical protein